MSSAPLLKNPRKSSAPLLKNPKMSSAPLLKNPKMSSAPLLKKPRKSSAPPIKPQDVLKPRFARCRSLRDLPARSCLATAVPHRTGFGEFVTASPRLMRSLIQLPRLGGSLDSIHAYIVIGPQVRSSRVSRTGCTSASANKRGALSAPCAHAGVPPFSKRALSASLRSDLSWSQC
jgi:hypothetical protein